MEWYWIIITLLIMVMLVLTYAVFNLIKKNEKQEEILLGYNKYLNQISNIIQSSDERLKELDRNKMFSSDDDIGFFFERVKDIQKVLNSFNVKNL